MGVVVGVAGRPLADEREGRLVGSAGFRFRVAPGVSVRASRRGLRTSLGPRAARLHVGSGRPGVSTGAGPFTYYTSLSGSSSRRRATSPAGRAAPGAAAADKEAEAQRLASQLQAIAGLNDVTFEPSRRPLAPPPAPVDYWSLLRRHRKATLAGVSVFDLSARRAAVASAVRAAESEHAEAVAAAVEGMYEEQSSLDETWGLLSECEPDVVLAALARAFEDNEAPAAPVGVEHAEASIVVRVPGPEVVPDRRPTTTSAGNLSLKKVSKTEAAAIYTSLVCGHVLLTAREAFAVVPFLDAVRIVAVRAVAPDGPPEVLMAAAFRKSAVDARPWRGIDALTALNDCSFETVLRRKGVTRALAPLDLRAEPAVAAVIDLIDLTDLMTDDDLGGRAR
ncbi:DUF4236 domain-containing protein [Nocardioides sp. YIM 152588]|uniref:DUF4236 domain-containing protein n=1 Tax=Nocardioides sp. YIM 152588 TaxID=3158259 RepID=UPI0032E3BE52